MAALIPFRTEDPPARRSRGDGRMKSPDPDLTADCDCFPVALKRRVAHANWHAWVELDGRRS